VCQGGQPVPCSRRVCLGAAVFEQCARSAALPRALRAFSRLTDLNPAVHTDRPAGLPPDR